MEFVIQIDKREKAAQKAIDYFELNNISYIWKSLKSGDYTAIIDGKSFENKIVIEKKHDLTELANNFTTRRRQFRAEMERIRESGAKMVLLIEDVNLWQNLFSHNYRSAMAPKSFQASILAWQAAYGFQILTCRPQDTGRMIYLLLYYNTKCIRDDEGNGIGAINFE